MGILQFFIHVLEIVCFIYLGFASLYIFFFAAAGMFRMHKKINPVRINRKMAVLIPGYKEDSVILEVANASLQQTYPSELFDIVIIADSFQPETIAALKELPVKLVEVAFKKSTKSKALNWAMADLGDDYQIAVVLDADNIMAPDFLDKMNRAFDSGFIAVQGHRIAKNMNNSMAVLDSISEEINNHIFRKGHRAVGLSSALIGSGMAFDYNMFKKRMAEIQAIGGFDKELELTMLRDGIRIEYLEDALVLDEKVQKTAVFENQRRRWLSAQFLYFRRFAWNGIVQFFSHHNIDFLDKVYQMIQPPRILLLGLVTVITASLGIAFLIDSVTVKGLLVLDLIPWIGLWLMTVLAFVFSVPGKFYTKKTLLAILMLPMGFWLMVKSLLKLKGANKTFIHTEHGVKDAKDNINEIGKEQNT
ncbi:MAG: glycosyltransferase family 2 protein [Bacteroidales bacterium]|jgi:cellulose synthase/poly-beta-1,6-N-acetylglucosamine synthase-like glycosyltransferase